MTDLAAKNGRMLCGNGRSTILVLALFSFLSCSRRGLGTLTDSGALPGPSGLVDGEAIAFDGGTGESGPVDRGGLGVESGAVESGAAEVGPPDLWGSGSAPGCTGLRIGPQTSIFVHLPVSPRALPGATATVCRTGTCATSTYQAPAGNMIWGSFVSAGGGGGAMVEDELDGFCRMQFSYPLADGTYGDGDVYSVKIVDANDRTLLDVSRPVRYGLENFNPRCGNPGNRFANLDLYPDSPSGITCDNNYCIYPGVRLTGTAPTSDPHAPITVTLCRNGTCQSGTTTIGSCPAGATCLFSGYLMESYLGSFEVQAKADGISFDVTSIDDSAALADGDAYAVVVAQGTHTLFSKSVTVTYSAEYLNGPQCDPVPCRHANVDLDSLP